MMFSSKTPRDLNHDPKPYVTYANEQRTDVRSAEWDIQSHGGTEYVRVFDPRPEFDHVQHNEPNPILVEFRARREDITLNYWLWAFEAEAAFGGWSEWDDQRHPAHSLTMATPDQIDHARRVLERLTRLEALS